MVARRRLKRPLKKSATTAAEAHQLHAARRVSLAEAAIDKLSTGKGKGAFGVDVEELQQEDERAEKSPKFNMPEESDSESEEEEEVVDTGKEKERAVTS